MPLKLQHVKDNSLGIIENAASQITGLLEPTLRLGVTGLSRAGKTVFITSLVKNLVDGGKLPMFEAFQSGRIAKVHLNLQPDDDVPRFNIEEHLENLIKNRQWPNSTRSISQLRLTFEFEKPISWLTAMSARRLHLDIIDYPGEWLLDLPLLSMSYREFSEQTIASAKQGKREHLSADWLKMADAAAHKWGHTEGHNVPDHINAQFPPDEQDIIELSDAFTTYLRACSQDTSSLSNLPPGRFLMPGELEGSPMVTFAPLPINQNGPKNGAPNKHSIYAIMEQRFESYKSKVIWPFYNNHFARLDRQVILVDALQALNKGPEALIDMEHALSEILASFNVGKDRFPLNFFIRKIDKILIAATKADHLHHESHDRLEALADRLVTSATSDHVMANIEMKTIAIAAVRATKEAVHESQEGPLPLIVGTPQKGDILDGKTFDGNTQKAIFPGDLPEDIDSFFESPTNLDQLACDSLGDLNIVRFRPPELEYQKAQKKALGPTYHSDTQKAAPRNGGLPHIRLDRAIEFLIGDKIK